MYNIIKMDLYRLLKTTSTKVMIIVVIAMTIFTVAMTKVDIDMMREDGQPQGVDEMTSSSEAIQVEGDSVEINVGIFSETKDEWVNNDIKFADLMEVQLASGIFLIIIAIFTSIFVYADMKRGYIKNIAGQVKNKWMLVVSKLVAVCMQNIIIFTVILITMFIAGRVCFEEQFVVGSLISIIKVTVGQYMLHLGFAAFILGMCIVFDSSEISMCLGILIASRMATILYFTVNRFIQNVCDFKDFSISEYAIETNIYSFSYHMNGSELTKALFIALIYVTVSVLVASFVTQKRDVK